MTLDQRALELLRRHGPRLRLNIECFPQDDLPYHVSVYSPEAGDWVTIAKADDPAKAILFALEPAEVSNIYSEVVH